MKKFMRVASPACLSSSHIEPFGVADWQGRKHQPGNHRRGTSIHEPDSRSCRYCHVVTAGETVYQWVGSTHAEPVPSKADRRLTEVGLTVPGSVLRLGLKNGRALNLGRDLLFSVGLLSAGDPWRVLHTSYPTDVLSARSPHHVTTVGTFTYG